MTINNLKYYSLDFDSNRRDSWFVLSFRIIGLRGLIEFASDLTFELQNEANLENWMKWTEVEDKMRCKFSDIM